MPFYLQMFTFAEHSGGTPIVPDTWKAETGGLLNPKLFESCLSNTARPHARGKKVHFLHSMMILFCLKVSLFLLIFLNWVVITQFLFSK